MILAFSSCRQEEASPIRNVKAGPTLLRVQAGDGPCVSYTYFLDNQKKSLGSVFTKQVLVSFSDGLSTEAEADILAKYEFVKGKNGQLSSNSAILHNVELTDGLNCKEVERAMRLLAGEAAITYVAPYFLNEDGLLGISNEAIVTVQDGQDAALQQLATTYRAEVLMQLSGKTYLVRVDKDSKGNALELANFLKNKPGIAHAEPDFVVSLQVSEETTYPVVTRRSRLALAQ
ncbi:S8 family serine peptidase [Pontibacter akesuensis]|nr:hypothetical protein [Pontibacter akesuensis]